MLTEQKVFLEKLKLDIRNKTKQNETHYQELEDKAEEISQKLQQKRQQRCKPGY
jgi:hypothetical protein